MEVLRGRVLTLRIQLRQSSSAVPLGQAVWEQELVQKGCLSRLVFPSSLEKMGSKKIAVNVPVLKCQGSAL